MQRLKKALLHSCSYFDTQDTVFIFVLGSFFIISSVIGPEAVERCSLKVAVFPWNSIDGRKKSYDNKVPPMSLHLWVNLTLKNVVQKTEFTYTHRPKKAQFPDRHRTLVAAWWYSSRQTAFILYPCESETFSQKCDKHRIL